MAHRWSRALLICYALLSVYVSSVSEKLQTMQRCMTTKMPGTGSKIKVWDVTWPPLGHLPWTLQQHQNISLP